MISLQAISYLLDYPDETLWQYQGELVATLAQAAELNPLQRAELARFIQDFCTAPLLDRQADYCALFDRGRATSLLLFEHVHGESRDRGQAMVDLLEQYHQAGLALDCKELPDFLPLYLEYLSSRTRDDAEAGLRDIAPILALLGARLHERESDYGYLFDLLLALSASDVRSENLSQQVAAEARDDTPRALDAVWEEEQVSFLGAQGCASAQQALHQKRCADTVQPQYLSVQSAATRRQPEGEC